jgi:hypothetical protein
MMTALADKPTPDRVLCRSLRARTSLLVHGARTQQVPVDTGVMHGPVEAWQARDYPFMSRPMCSSQYVPFLRLRELDLRRAVVA